MSDNFSDATVVVTKFPKLKNLNSSCTFLLKDNNILITINGIILGKLDTESGELSLRIIT